MSEKFSCVSRQICKAILGGILLVSAASPASGEQAGPLSAVTPDPRLANYSPGEQAVGGLKIHGSDTMYPLLTRLSTEFRRRQPLVAIEVKGGGSAKALANFIRIPTSEKAKEEKAGQTFLVSSSRELMPSEISQFATGHGHDPLGIPVAVDAVAIYVHRDNTIEGLTLDQVDAIFSLSRNRGYPAEVKSWGQLGLSAGWQNAPIRIFGRDRRSGTRTFFQEHVLAGGDFKPSMQEEPGAASVILALSQSPLGIAFNGLGLHSSMVRIVPLAEKKDTPFVAPSDATIADQTYPLRRVLYLYLDTSSAASLHPVAKEFVSFINSREGQEAVTRAGFFPLPMSQIEHTLAALDPSGVEKH
jgi:phosphate transport system substrate-binding protein